MRAITYTEYGGPEVLRLREVADPTPGAGEVLVRIRAASVNPLDWHFMRGRPYFMRAMSGLRRPKTLGLGVDVAGQVEALGKDVTEFRAGDDVFGACRGAFAEYVCASEGALVRKPANVTFEQAAAVPVAAFTALQGLRDKARVQAGQKVLINGAAGGVGTFAVQIAKWMKAEVTGVCSARNVDLVRSIGADQVIDHTQEDFTKRGPRYDAILDSVGNHTLSDLRQALTTGGTLVLIGGPDKGDWLGPLARLLRAVAVSPFVSQRLLPLMAHWSKDDVNLIRGLLEAGTVTPVIDRSYPLDQVPEAIRYLEEGHARGKVLIRAT